jgi:hypothetical protein
VSPAPSPRACGCCATRCSSTGYDH